MYGRELEALETAVAASERLVALSSERSDTLTMLVNALKTADDNDPRQNYQAIYRDCSGDFKLLTGKLERAVKALVTLPRQRE